MSGRRGGGPGRCATKLIPQPNGLPRQRARALPSPGPATVQSGVESYGLDACPRERTFATRFPRWVTVQENKRVYAEQRGDAKANAGSANGSMRVGDTLLRAPGQAQGRFLASYGRN